MIIKSVNIGSYCYNHSLLNFTRIFEKDSIIIVKNKKLAELLKDKVKPNQVQLSEIHDNIFLLESFGNQTIIPSDLENCSTIYYLYSNDCDFEDGSIVEHISEEEISAFLKEIDFRHAEWQVLSKCFLKSDGKLYVLVRSKSTRNKKIEYWFSDLYTCIWDVDEKWSNYLYDNVLKPWLKDYYDKKMIDTTKETH